MLKTEAIKTFLNGRALPDLAALYNHDMECQVNVAQDGGERIEGDYKGKLWQGWSDGITTWKSFRIPYKAYSDPEYEDRELYFPLDVHVEAIGMTGWDWKSRVSKWVAYDFDAIMGHSNEHNKTISETDLQNVVKAAKDIPWVTIRKSTSGNGLHLYVKLPNVPTNTHTEHSALARSILGTMSAMTGFDFHAKVDVCGGNMWVWHRKMMGTDGLTLIKDGCVLDDVPVNWKDHLNVVSGKAHRAGMGQEEFETLANNYTITPLDDDHKNLIKWLQDNGHLWWWDNDRHILVTHSYLLKLAYKALGMIGIYDTLSKGTNVNEQNCFCFPLAKGAWLVRRFTPGVNEAHNWEQDGSGWTRTYLNRKPSFAIACKAYGGLENDKGAFVFRTAEAAMKAATALGVVINMSPDVKSRAITLRIHKDGRILAEMEHDPNDRADDMTGWLCQKNKWTKLYSYHEEQTPDDTINYDSFVRHLISEADEDSGWAISRENIWGVEPLGNIKIALGLNLAPKMVNTVIGSAVLKPYKLVNKPFQEEYPGNREWNRDGAQLRFQPLPPDQPRHYPHWLSILEHCGEALDREIAQNAWAKANGILTGADYLKLWIACVLQRPTEPLPFLFFYSPEQNTGKSIFHEALDLLMTKGYMKANEALTSSSAFNGELAGALICVIEELDLNGNKVAYNRLKDWVTGRKISIRPIYQQSYMATNTTHWICCTNDHKYCPIFPGDTRIVVAKVNPLPVTKLIPKPMLEAKLIAEAPAFLAEVLRLEIPRSYDRLALPVISSQDKQVVESLNKPALDMFLDECYEYCPGNVIPFKDVYDRFVVWADNEDAASWTKIKFSKNLPPKYPCAKIRGSADKHIGNIKPIDADILPKGKPLQISGVWLVND